MLRSRLRALILSLIVLLILLMLADMIIASSYAYTAEDTGEIFVWTKAVCNEKNYCVDMQITCISGQVADIKPAGPGIQFSGRWNDPRTEEQRKELC